MKMLSTITADKIKIKGEVISQPNNYCSQNTGFAFVIKYIDNMYYSDSVSIHTCIN